MFIVLMKISHCTASLSSMAIRLVLLLMESAVDSDGRQVCR
jgi:hypothetical protein